MLLLLLLKYRLLQYFTIFLYKNTPHSYPPLGGLWYRVLSYLVIPIIQQAPACSQDSNNGTSTFAECAQNDPSSDPKQGMAQTGEIGLYTKYWIYCVFFSPICLAFLNYFMFFLGPQRHPESFLEPMASFSQSMSPWRATATPFMSKMTSSFRTLTSQITNIQKLFLIL